MWELDHKESWALKNWCFWTVVLEKTLENPLYCKEIQSVHPKGNQSWIFIGRTDAEAEALILWLPDAKNWLIGKAPDPEKDWRQEERGMTEDVMVGLHHQLESGHEFEQAPRPGVLQSMELQRVGHDWVTELNWTEALILKKIFLYPFLSFSTILCSQCQSKSDLAHPNPDLAHALNPEMICYLSKRQQMILSANTLYSISLFHPSSSPGDRFTVLHGFTERKHCYYLHLLSSHLLVKKKNGL